MHSKIYHYKADLFYLNSKNKKMENQINGNDQTQFSDSSNKSQKPAEKARTGESKYSVLGVITTIILVIIVIMLGERLIFDANRMLNPVVEQDYTNWKNNSQQQQQGYGFSEESPETFSPTRGIEMGVDVSTSPVSSTKVYYPKSEKGRYLMYELIIHAVIIIPLFILAFALFYFKKDNNAWRPIVIGLALAGFWLMLHLLGETTNFVMDAYRNIAIYIILIVLALIFGGLTFYAQSKHAK